jgi:hypothetical protein
VALSSTIRTLRSRDITDSIPFNVGQPSYVSDIWTNTTVAYDVAIGGLPFFYGINNDRPYERQTAPYKKQQFDNSKEPGEQTLEGWWIRSQSSFHRGAGITFFDPSAGEEVDYRFSDSENVNVWNKGQVSLLKNVTQTHNITGTIAANGRPKQHSRTIRYGDVDAVLVLDEYDVDKMFQPRTGAITNKALTSNVATLTSVAHTFTVGMQVVVTGVDATFNGEYRITAVTTDTFSYAKTATNVTSQAATGSATSEVIHFIDYISGADEPVYAICDDGTTAYWVTNKVAGGANKIHVYKKALSADSTTAETLMFAATGIVVANATMEFIKERIVMCVNNSVYEFSTTATSLPTALYTNSSTDYQFTSIAASGPAIYVSGFRSHQSSITKFTLTTAGAMPTLTAATTAAEFPVGEIVFRIYYYLGYMVIGTNKGIRVAQISPDDGSIAYGPIIVPLVEQPCFDFAARDRFVWCATGVKGSPGVIRIDLSEQISPLRFAYANDVFYADVTGHYTTSCAFIGLTDQIFFTSAAGSVGYGYCEDVNTYATSGFLQTGYIRYGTLEPKNFKRVRCRGDYSTGGLLISPVGSDGTVYETAIYNSTIGTPEINIINPPGSQEYIGMRFTLSRYEDPTDTASTLDTTGPTFKGYQVRALPATPRQHLIQLPLYCYDVETDRYNVQVGYDGRSWERIQALEDLESTGDEVIFQDFTTGEQITVVIDSVGFQRATPPSGGFSGFGGNLTVIVREVG